VDIFSQLMLLLFNPYLCSCSTAVTCLTVQSTPRLPSPSASHCHDPGARSFSRCSLNSFSTLSYPQLCVSVALLAVHANPLGGMTLPITIVHLNVMLTWFHMQMNDLWVWHTHVYVCARETCDRTCYELHLLYVSRSLVHLFTSTAKF